MAFFIDESFINGLLQLAGLFLSIAAGILAVSLFNISNKTKHLWSWRVLIIALIVFGIHKLFSALHSFNILKTSYLGQIFPFIIMSLVLWAVVFQIQIIKVEQAKQGKK